MKYDFTSVIDRMGKAALAVEALGQPGFPARPREGFDAIPMWVADMNFPTCPAIPAAVEDVSVKLSILAARQDALEDRRTARVSSIITVFGLVSILDSALSIAQSLQSGDPLLYECTKLTVILLTVLLLLAAVRRK